MKDLWQSAARICVFKELFFSMPAVVYLFLVHPQMGLKFIFIRCGVITAGIGTWQQQATVLLDLVPL